MKTIEKKEPYLQTLNTQGNIYEEFLPDQVLTHKNLNKVVNYFEDQDRLSRVYLIGVGVGCGLNIVSYSNSYIEIGQGVGITSDGDIIKSETRRFHYYSVLTDRSSYELFDGLQVYEIYEQEGAGRLSDELPLSSFTSNEPGALKDYILIAYVENYTEDEGLCGGSGCDETGNKVYSNIKFLLTHKNNKSKLTLNDTIYNSHDVLSYYDTLPELCMPRLLLTKDNTTSGISIHDQFTTSFSLKADLYDGITTIIDRFDHRINFAKYGVTVPQITTYFDDIFVDQEEPFIQYKYDLLKDLIDTYREIRELILHVRFECVANLNAFPKHLLLGTLEEQTRLQTRHEFYPSPTVSENDENLLAIKALCIKFFNQLKEYRIPNVSSTAIKVTPSKSYEFKLSERSIPYYYETKNSLISNWNPISIQQRKPKNQLGYHVSNLKNIPCIQKPLEYSHLDKDFYRIEGHLGKDFRLALRKINALKAKYNLAFDVKTVSIGFPVNKVSLDDDTCNTKDYTILLKTWEQEFCCIAEGATEFFSKYQFDDLGNNDTKTTVYAVANQQPQQLLSLLGRESADKETSNPERIAGKAINTNVEALESGQRVTSVAYNRSIQYAIDMAYSNIGSQNVSAAHLAAITLAIVDQDQGNVDRDSDYYFYTEVPVKIIAGLTDIKRNFLTSLDDIYVTEKWTALNNAIEGLCAEVDQVLFAISEATDNTAYGTKTHDKMYEFFIYELSKICCLKEKLAWLKVQIDEIRSNLYREIILSKLIEKHPGLEHMAGVPKGGTFLMVYLGGTEELLEDDTKKISKFNGIVQFDFALPYMCCSDCPPETIVYNVEPETTLTIAKTKYCLPEDEGQVDFITQSSGDGVVTSPEGDAFIVATDSGYAFDPSAVPDNLIGEVLTFLVDGKVPTTPVEICVFKFPTDITANYESPVWSDAGITIDLTVSHEDLSYSYNYTYTWNRADGSEIGTDKDLSGIFFESIEDRFEETLTLAIGIEGTPVACTVIVDIPVDESRAIDIDVPPIICYNLQETSPMWVLVSVTPDGALLSSPEDATPSFIEQNDAGDYFIDPIKVPHDLAGNEITFEVNGTAIVGKSTRVGMLPAFINRDEGGNELVPYEIVEWNEEGALINLRASHQFQSETYIEYRWIDRDDTDLVIGTTRLVNNVQVRGEGNTISARYRVEMRVIGLEDSCTTFFDVDITLERPTLDIPIGLCSPESILLEVNPDDSVTTSATNNLIQNISDTITLESGLLDNSEVGVPIEVFLNDSLAATTTIYKVPSTENVRATNNLVRWSGEDVIINLSANPRVPGVTNPENYLEVKWFDNAGNPILEEDLAEYPITSVEGTVETTFSVTVCVKSDLGLVNPCEVTVPVPISYTRPTFELERGYCYDIIETDDIIISISPADFAVTSPQGSNFIIPNGDHHIFRLSEVGPSLIGQRIGFEIDGTEVTHTHVYRVPTVVADYSRPVTWDDDVLVIDLTTTYDLAGVSNPENYLKIDWFDRNGNPISTTTGHRITAANGNVDVTYSVIVSVDPSLMDTDPCSSEPIDVPIDEDRPEPEPTLPTDLGLLDGYCWKEGDQNLNITIPVSPNDFTITSPQVGSTILRANSASYTFRASSIANTLAGNLIEFRIGATTIDSTRVFKLPADASIFHDRQNSIWQPGSYTFKVGHNFADESYLSYEVKRSSNGESIEQVGVGLFKVPVDNSINERFDVTIFVNGLDCSSFALITVSDILDGGGPTEEGPTNPTTGFRQLNCSNSYTNRITELGVNTDLGKLETTFESESFGSTITTNVITPMKNVVKLMETSSNVNNDSISGISQINNLRDELNRSFLRSPNFRGDKKPILELDELLEIMSLELLRCVDENNSELSTIYNDLITASNDRETDYGTDTRSKITQEYLDSFDTKDDTFKTTISNTFTKSSR
ncbi:hypothetical protein [Kordia sp.]|uniref:hypothetical protein n=1 Tax=Kordia sp. TaxID=1965332 RepID=UPI003D6B8497